MFREAGYAEFDPTNVNGSDSNYPEVSVEEVNEPGILRGRGVVVEEKYNEVVVVGDKDNKYKVPLKNK